MARTLQDENFLTWEVFPSAGDHGFSEQPYLVFNCLTDRNKRPRLIEFNGDEADAERFSTEATDAQLLDLLDRARVQA
jgi:hypothetical protein